LNRSRRISAYFLIIISGLTSCQRHPPTITFLNWDDYTGAGVKESFTRSTGITINEKNYGTNEELMGILENTHADIIVPSTYAVDILAAKGRLGPLAWSSLNNAAMVPQAYRNMPEAKHCIPYTWSAIAFFYDRTKLSTAPGLDILFDPKKRKPFAGHILLLDDRRAMLGLALRYLGYSVNTIDAEALSKATALLREVKKDTLLFASGLLVDRIASTPSVWLGVSWSGDARWAAAKRPDINVILPDQTVVYVDWACITHDATPAATKFLDHLLDPKEAAALTQTTHYSPVNLGAESRAPADIQSIIKEWREASARINPEMIQDVGPIGDQKYETAWLAVKQ